MKNKDKIILDLCGGTGAWSRLYKEAGYKVYNITLPKYDLSKEDTVKYCINLNPYGILFACPCDMWCNMGVQFFPKRTPGQIFNHALILVHGLRIIYNSKLKFWCLENPVGKMKDFMGIPQLNFQPWEWGNRYTKQTYLWGKFKMPMFKRIIEPTIIDPVGSEHRKACRDGWTGGKRKERRAITPSGFAKAFFDANQ